MVPYPLKKMLLLEFLRVPSWALFFTYLYNDLSDQFSPSIYCSIFADDAKVGTIAKYAHGKYELQNKLDKLAAWISHWKQFVYSTLIHI